MMQLEGATSLWATILGSQPQWLIPWCKQLCMILSLPPTWWLHHIQCKWHKWQANSKLLCYSSSSNSSRWWWWWWANNSNLQILSTTLMEAVSTPMAQVGLLFKHTIHIRALFRSFARSTFFLWKHVKEKSWESGRLWFLRLGMLEDSIVVYCMLCMCSGQLEWDSSLITSETKDCGLAIICIEG